MNRFFTKLNKLKICLLLFTSLLAVESYGQQAGCNVILTSIRDTIACGESIDLEAIGLGGLQTDDFAGSSLSGLWQSVTAGYTIGGPCGMNPNGGAHLWFGTGCAIPRAATTVPVDASCVGTISFDFRQETQSGNCDGPDIQKRRCLSTI